MGGDFLGTDIRLERRVTKTLVAWQHCCTEILAGCWILQNFHTNLRYFVDKFSQKLTFFSSLKNQSFLLQNWTTKWNRSETV